MVEVLMVLCIKWILIIVIYFSIIITNMFHMFINFLNYIMVTIVMVMSRHIVSYMTCMFYFPL